MVEPRLKVGPGCYPRVYLCMAGPGRPLGTDAERRSLRATRSAQIGPDAHRRAGASEGRSDQPRDTVPT
jgi:hypothetical protein